MAQEVEALHYKLEGRWFDSSPHYGSGVDLASKTNEYKVYLLRGKGGPSIGLTTLPPSCADGLVILGAETSCIPKGLFRCVMISPFIVLSSCIKYRLTKVFEPKTPARQHPPYDSA